MISCIFKRKLLKSIQTETDCKIDAKEHVQHTKNELNENRQFEVIVNEATGGEFICEICKKKFRSKGGMKQHMERHFTKSSQYVCDKCDAIFLVATHLHQHECGLE